MRNLYCFILFLFCCTCLFSCSSAYYGDVEHLREKDFYLVVENEGDNLIFARKNGVYYCCTEERIYVAKEENCEYFSRKTGRVYREDGAYYHQRFSEVFEALQVHTVEEKDGQTAVSCWWGEGKRRTERYVLIYRDGAMEAIGSYDTPQAPLETRRVVEWSQSVPENVVFEVPEDYEWFDLVEEQKSVFIP